MLEITDLHASIDGKEILRGINLAVSKGEVHAIMGPNGSGKSTLASILMGHPKFEVTRGSIRFMGRELNGLSADERARLGLFLSFQYPFEIAGLGFTKFLFQSYKAVHPKEKTSLLEFNKKIQETLSELKIDPAFAKRELNVGFSGGEKKRAEIAQLMLLKPKLAVLDETDSGLDIDSLRVVSEAVEKLRNPEFSAVVITHYKRILNYLKPDFVHVLVDGKIAESGSFELAGHLEEKGYSWLAEKVVAVK
ncbi:MAG: Fe-S cluster assembly ATPase SufC [Candidatus Diapherotrites archaeon]|nr:Fe-S cluster assembly ATPase SufC [Candidatus Diapherotrites archaeon]